jgi:hypothetical protein
MCTGFGGRGGTPEAVEVELQGIIVEKRVVVGETLFWYLRKRKRRQSGLNV